jgi:chromosomal replication initiator protein
MSEMVLAIQGTKSGSDKVAEFRRKYTELVDILIIDDIHELQGKTRTQAEFFYVFNQLTARKKQLIFTSDKPPKEIIGLEDRVMTRLNSALIVDIQQPDLETRIAILKKKALEKDIYLDDQIINLIANSVKSSVRELEGKLVKLGAYSDLMNVDIDIEIAKQQLNLENITNEKILNSDSITKAVASYFSLAIGDIKGKTRKKEIALARHISMYMIHKLAKITLEDIGKYFDGRDHSTVIHGIKKINDITKSDTRLSQQIYEIETQLN